MEWNRLLSQSKQWEGVNYFQSEDEMLALLDQNGVSMDKTIIVHCQAGVRASFTYFCLKMLGYPEVKLYDGSMDEWANGRMGEYRPYTISNLGLNGKLLAGKSANPIG